MTLAFLLSLIWSQVHGQSYVVIAHCIILHCGSLPHFASVLVYSLKFKVPFDMHNVVILHQDLPVPHPQ